MFDRSSSGISPFQGLRLAAAIQEFQSGGERLIGIGREALGVDAFDISGSGGADTTASAGKYISDNVLLEVQQGVTSGSAKAKLEDRADTERVRRDPDRPAGYRLPPQLDLRLLKDRDSRNGRLLAAGASLLFDSTAIRGEIVEVLASPPYPIKAIRLAQVRRLVLGHHPQFHPSGATQATSLCLAFRACRKTPIPPQRTTPRRPLPRRLPARAGPGCSQNRPERF